MASNIRLLRQLVNGVSTVEQHTSDPHLKVLLSISGLYLNELMLRDAPEAHLQYLGEGTALMAEGMQLAASLGNAVQGATLPRADLTIESRFDVVEEELARLNECLVEIVKVLDESRSRVEKDYLVRLSQWEIALHTRRLAFNPARAGAQEELIGREPLQAYLRRKFPHQAGMTVTRFQPLEGGLSKKTILFETDDAVNGRQAMVIRAQQRFNLLYQDGSDVAQEFYMCQLMRRGGIAVPEPLWVEDDASALGTRFMVSRMASGEPKGGVLGAYGNLDARMLDSIMRTLCRMHSIRIDADDPMAQRSHLQEWLPHRTIRDTMRHLVTEFLWKLINRAHLDVTPQLMRALRWLEKNVPECDEPPVVVHIDYGFNNLLFEDNEVSAVLDWETSRFGDPAEDIIWTQQNIGAYTMSQFLEKYGEATGRTVSEYRLAYARLVKCVLFTIAGLSALRSLAVDDNAPFQFGQMAFKYLSLFGSNIDQLIREAEAARA